MDEKWKKLIWTFGYFTAVTRGATEATKKFAEAWESTDEVSDAQVREVVQQAPLPGVWEESTGTSSAE